VLHTHTLSDTTLELLHHWPIIGKPLVIQDLIYASKEGTTITDIGATDMQGLRERGLTPIYGKIGFTADRFDSHDS